MTYFPFRLDMRNRLEPLKNSCVQPFWLPKRQIYTMKKTLVLVFFFVMLFTTAFALPPGVLVREWSCHIVAGEVELPEDIRTTEEESEQQESEKPEGSESVDSPVQSETLESSEGKEMLEKPEQVVSSPTDLFDLVN